MKKYLILSILFPLIVLGQSYSNPYTPPQQVNVTVQKNPYDFSSSFNQGMQAGAAARQAAAASQQAAAARSSVYNEAMKDNYSNITLDLLINNTNNYEYVVLESFSGWMPQENKKDVMETLIAANKYKVIDMSPDYKSNGEAKDNDKTYPSELLNNPKVLVLNWYREAQGDVIRISKLTVKNYEGKIVYESISKNLSYQEILMPLTSNYIYTKEVALSKIEEYKKYLDLGVISKEEFDIKVAELKPILMGGN